MKPGAVVVDVAIDQGGCFETSKPTSHSDPVYDVDGVIHYCVTNMPGAVARTSTLALSNVTLPYGLALADKGLVDAARAFPELAKGINVLNGIVTYKAVADAFGLSYRAVGHRGLSKQAPGQTILRFPGVKGKGIRGRRFEVRSSTVFDRAGG